MRQIFWSDDALNDVQELARYIARDNPKAAMDVMDRIDTAIGNLAQIPTGRIGRVAGTYEKPIDGLPYIVAYALQPRQSGERVVVLRIIHGARNWPEGEWPE